MSWGLSVDELTPTIVVQGKEYVDSQEIRSTSHKRKYQMTHPSDVESYNVAMYHTWYNGYAVKWNHNILCSERKIRGFQIIHQIDKVYSYI